MENQNPAESWLIQDTWNDAFLEDARVVEPRNYIRASEIGKAFLDRYYQMNGVQYSDKFDARTLRVFETGNIFEWIVRLVLIRAGILRSEQKEVTIEGIDGVLPIIGHYDFVAGGEPNWKQAEAIVPLLEQLHFPTRMLTISSKLIENLKISGQLEAQVE